MMTAWHILAVVVLCLLLVWFIDKAITRARTNALKQLAHQHGVRYSPFDRFRITHRIIADLPVAAAADVRVRDLMYIAGTEFYVYVFTIEYALGTVNGITRHTTTARATEPVGRSCGRFIDVHFAPRQLTRVQQYQALLSQPIADSIADPVSKN
jgi:hypothetical protein